MISVIAAFGCGGTVHDDDPSASAVAVQQPVDAVQSRPVDAALGRCKDTTHGSLDTYRSPAELSARLVRQWVSCETDSTGSLFRRRGIQFFADGTWALLEDDGQGGLRAHTGIEFQGTWDVYRADGTFHPPTDTAVGDYTYVYVRMSGGFVPAGLAFERGPERMRALEATAGTTSWLVPLTP